MRRLDRYVLTEMIPPFLFGVAAFMAVLMGIGALYEMLTLIFRKGFPVLSAVQIFLYNLPGTVVMTLPMATMFASLTAVARLSADGELVAMRAGGLSLARIGASIIAVGALISLLSLGINELAVPYFNDRAFTIMRDAYSTAAGGDDMAFEVRGPDGRLQRWLYGQHFDPEKLTLEQATILDFTRGSPELFTAQHVQWQGETWILENVEHTRWHPGGSERISLQRVQVKVGRSPDEVARVRKRPEEMSLQELVAQAQVEQGRGNDAAAGRLLQHIQVRLAAPWSSLGFAMLGLTLGVRKLRTSRGIGMGLSVAILFVYYIVMNTLSVLGERSMAHHMLIAWIPNLLLYLCAIGLLLRGEH